MDHRPSAEAQKLAAELHAKRGCQALAIARSLLKYSVYSGEIEAIELWSDTCATLAAVNPPPPPTCYGGGRGSNHG